MKRIPRASLSINILTDEDYGVLMSRDDGPEVFGVFVAMVVAGRERLQQEKAIQVPGTEALRFENKTAYVLSIARITQDRLNRCLAALEEIAEETDSQPWMYVDAVGYLVIRSFFKFNTRSGWGGHRDGSGRPPTVNQVDSRNGIKMESSGNQDEINLITDDAKPADCRNEIKLIPTEIKMDSRCPKKESTRYDSGSGSGSGLSERDAGEETGNPSMQIDGPIGVNSAAQVRETLGTAESLFPLSNVRILARNWLGETTAARIIAALHATAQKTPQPNRPAAYAKVLLDDPTFPQVRKNGSAPPRKPAIVLECDRMFVNPDRVKPGAKP